MIKGTIKYLITGNQRIKIKFRSMLGTILRYISVPRTEIIGNTILRYNWNFFTCEHDRGRDRWRFFQHLIK